MVDFFILVFIGFHTFSGLRKGIVRLLIELALLCLAYFVSYFVYQTTHNFILSIISFLILSLLFSILTKIGFRILTSDKRRDYNKVSFINSLIGGIFGLIWGAFGVFLILLAITLIPDKLPYISSIKAKIEASRSFKAVSILTKKQTAKALNKKNASVQHSLSQKAPEQKAISKDLKELLTNQKIQSILSDEKTLEQIRDNDIMKIMNNPKIIDMLGDTELMKKLLEMHFKGELNK